jgi:hypothetical protein
VVVSIVTLVADLQTLLMDELALVGAKPAFTAASNKERDKTPVSTKKRLFQSILTSESLRTATF